MKGEAHFVVTKNPVRPFVVTAGNLKVRAVGTGFAIKLGAEDTDLLVTEGKVLVERVPEPGLERRTGESGARTLAPIEVSAGEFLAVPTSGMPLGETLGIFNREAHVDLSVTDPELAKLRISGVFRADNVDGFLRLLEKNYGVWVERRDDEMLLHSAGWAKKQIVVTDLSCSRISRS